MKIWKTYCFETLKHIQQFGFCKVQLSAHQVHISDPFKRIYFFYLHFFVAMDANGAFRLRKRNGGASSITMMADKQMLLLL